MPRQRKEGKKLWGGYLEPPEFAKLDAAAVKFGFETRTAFLNWIANNCDIFSSRFPKSSSTDKGETTKLPPDLAEVAERRAKDLGYPSWNAYVKGLIRYDATVQGPHQLTVPWSKLPLEEQDRIDAKLLELTKAGVGERGQFLQHLLDKIEEKK